MIVLVGQTKGGVGKSMFATNLAAMAAAKGQKCVLVDADRQKTSERWCSTRAMRGVKPDIRVVCMRIEAGTSIAEFGDGIQRLKEDFDNVIIDCGGADGKELRASMMQASVLVAPAKPSQADIWGLSDLDEILQEVHQFRPDLRGLVVLNMVDPLNIHNSTGIAVEALKELDTLEFIGWQICNRATFNSAFRVGRGVVDLERAHKPFLNAIKDIEGLYERVFEAKDAEQVKRIPA